MINGLLTLRGAWDKVREDPVLKFMVVAVTCYGMSTFEGPMMSLKSVNAIAHFTDWVYRSRSCGRTWLERIPHIRYAVLVVPDSFQDQDSLPQIGQHSLLAGNSWYCILCSSNVLGRVHTARNVERIHPRQERWLIPTSLKQ